MENCNLGYNFFYCRSSSQGGRADRPLPKVVEETGGGSNQLGKEEVLDGDTTSRKENVASAGDVELTAKPALQKKDE